MNLLWGFARKWLYRVTVLVMCTATRMWTHRSWYPSQDPKKLYEAMSTNLRIGKASLRIRENIYPWTFFVITAIGTSYLYLPIQLRGLLSSRAHNPALNSEDRGLLSQSVSLCKTRMLTCRARKKPASEHDSFLYVHELYCYIAHHNIKPRISKKTSVPGVV